MTHITALSEEQIKRGSWKNYSTFTHAFGGYNRVFGFGGQLILSKNVLDLQSLLVSCSGICSSAEGCSITSSIKSAATLHGWTLLSESENTCTYVLRDYTLTWSQIPYGTEEFIIHVILTLGENEEAVYRRLFQKITKLLDSSLQGETRPSKERQVPPEMLVEPIHRITIGALATRLENRQLIAYTGAGISQASGIHTFVGEGSLEQFFPLIEAFPGKVVHWMVDQPDELSICLGRFHSSFVIAEPNNAHKSLAELEKSGILGYIITSNFDDLHQLAGSRKVYFSRYAKQTVKNGIYTDLLPNALLVVGISQDEDHIVDIFRSIGCQIVIVDIHPPPFIQKDDWYVEGPAEQILPVLAAHLHKTRVAVTDSFANPPGAIETENHHSRMKLNFPELINTVRMKAPNRASILHGERHWQQVAWIGCQLAKHVPGCDAVLVLLFSILHDSMRVSDGFDPGHGLRAGEFARSLNGILYKLSPLQIDLLDAACFAHSEGDISYDSTVAVCWDSDRLDLWRCDIEPDPQWLSTAQAKDLKWITWAKDLQFQVFDWSTIWSEFQAIEAQLL